LARTPRNAWPGVIALLARPVSCRLRHGKLHFTWAKEDMDYSTGVMRLHTRRPARPPASLWREFISLNESPVEEIRCFAETFGPLRPSGGVEDPQEWRDYARLALHFSLAVGAMHDGVKSDPRWWSTLREWCRTEIGDHANDGSLRVRKLLVAASLTKWLSQPGCYVPAVGWRGDALTLRPTARSVLGVVGLQMALTLSRTVPLVACSGCGTAIEPSKQASRGTRRYCAACRAKGRPVRDAARDYRREQKLQGKRKR
jgi:hypothetical protein